MTVLASKAIFNDSHIIVDERKQPYQDGAMSKSLGKALAAARSERRLTQEAVAAAIGVTRAAVGQWEKGITEPSLQNLLTACQVLDVSVQQVTKGIATEADVYSHPTNEPKPLRQNDFKTSIEELEALQAGRYKGPYDVYGKITVIRVKLNLVSKPGDFVILQESVGSVAMTKNLESMSEVFGMYVSSTVMAPRYEVGDLIILSPDRPASEGDDVVIVFEPDELSGTIDRGSIRRLVGRSDVDLEVQYLNPPTTETIQLSLVKELYRILPLQEILSRR